MRHLLFIVLACGAAGGCVHRGAKPAPAPSVGAVKSGLSQAQVQLGTAQAEVGKIGERVTAARNKAERIDHKATVLLENWR